MKRNVFLRLGKLQIFFNPLKTLDAMYIWDLDIYLASNLSKTWSAKYFMMGKSQA